MAGWSPWDTPKPAASPFDSKKVRASFEKYSDSSLSDDRFDSASSFDKPVTSGWQQDLNTINGYNSKGLASSTRSAMPSETSPSISDGVDSTQNDFLTRYTHLKELEKYKNELIEELLCRYQFLSEKYSQLSSDHGREREYNRTTQKRERTYQENIRILQAHLDRDPFVLVLLDADGLMFQNVLLKQGEAGGKAAADLLHDAILNHVMTNFPDLPPDVRTVVRVYGNLKGLGDSNYRAGVTDRISRIEEFVLGFTQGRTLYDFVDVGTGKDHAEAKIIETLQLHLNNFQCRQIFLGCAHRVNYVQILEEIGTDEQTLNRVTLARGSPIAKQVKHLPFEIAKFDNLFQASKSDLDAQSAIQNSLLKPSRNDSPCGSPATMFGRQLSQMNLNEVKEFTPVGLPAARAAEISSGSPKPSPSLKWASVAARAAPAPSSSPKPAPPAVQLTSHQTPRNRKGQRVDPIIKHDKAEVDRVKKLKMCNVHYLRAECPYGDACTHIHNYKPTTAELQTLRLVARMAPCMNGSECDDVKCIYGHICPAPEGRDGKDCIFGEACRFPTDLHKIDRQIIKTLKV